MSDFTARITEILTTHQDVDLGVEGERSWLAAFLAAAAEQHYRPRIETVEQLNAWPSKGMQDLVRSQGINIRIEQV